MTRSLKRKLEKQIHMMRGKIQWAEWLDRNIGEFREQIKTAGEVRDNPVRSTILLKAWAMNDDEQDEGEKTKRQQPSAAISSYKQPVAD